MPDNEAKLIAVVDANTKQLENALKRIERLSSQSFDRAAGSTRKLDDALKRTSLAAGGLQKALSFGKSFGGGLLAGAGLAGLEQIAGTIRSVIGEAAGLKDVADKIGLSTTALQELHFAATQSGVEIGELDASMLQFSKRVGEAAAGAGPLVQILQANGVAIKDASGNLLPLNDLLDRYANLIKGAKTHQDALVLATAAFGKAGAGMVNVLRDGASGLDDARRKAHDLGTVLDEELIGKAAKIDDEFDAMTAAIGTRFKAGVLTAVGVVYQMLEALDEFEAAAGRIGNSSFFQKIAAGLGVDTSKVYRVVPGQGIVEGPAGGLTPAQSRARDRAFNTRDRDAFYGPSGGPATVVPGTGGGGGGGADREAAARNRAADAAQRQADAVKEHISDLEFELSMVGKSDTEQRVANELRLAGANATAEQKARIEELIPQIEAEKAAHDHLVESMDQVRDIAGGALSSFNQGLRDGQGLAGALKGALDNVLDSVIKIAEQAAITGLFGAQGTAGGGLLGSLFGGLSPAAAGLTGAGLFHSGGIVGAPGGRSRSVPSALFAGAPRYHSGGVAGLRRGEVPAILQKGELVIPNTPGRVGGAGNAAAAPVTISVNVSGARGNQEITAMVHQGVALGLEHYDKQYNNAGRIGAKMGDYNRRFG